MLAHLKKKKSRKRDREKGETKYTQNAGLDSTMLRLASVSKGWFFSAAKVLKDT